MTEENGSPLRPDDGKPESSKDIARYPDQKDGNPNPPNSNTVTVTANAKHAANEGRRRTNDNQKHWLEYLTALLALVAAISGSLAAGFSYYQGWVARDTETRYLRSYVMIESSTIGIDSSGKPTAHLVIKNYGLTPVYNFRHWACTVVRSWPDRDQDFPTASMMTNSARAPESLIAPNATILKDAGSCFSNEEPISETVRAEIRAGRKAVFAIGVMKYRDAFGIDRETRYRRSWNDIRSADGYGGNCADNGCPKDK